MTEGDGNKPKAAKKKAAAKPAKADGGNLGEQIFAQFERGYAGLVSGLKETEKKMARQAADDLAALYALRVAMPVGDDDAWQQEVDLVKASLENIAAAIGQKAVRAVRDSMSAVLNKAMQFAFSAL